MRKAFSFSLLVFVLTGGIFAQSARVKPLSGVSEAAAAKEEVSALKMYAEANDYAKTKFAEFNEKKVSFNEALRQKTLREQRELAAKYAAILKTRSNLPSEDIFYLGMLHWLAENTDGASETLQRYLASETVSGENAQTARGIVVITSARKKNFEIAETFLANYLGGTPLRIRERSEMVNELAAAYFAAKNFEKAAEHGEEAYRIVKSYFEEQTSRARGLAEILDRGSTLFDIYKDSGNQSRADAILDDLRKISVSVQSNGIYYYAVDNQIKYLIATNRKPAAMALSEKIKKNIESDFADKLTQAELIRRFQKREKHYALLGETAPELVEIAAWLPGETKLLASLRGKVVVLDFWATWCGPCYETFPLLKEMFQIKSKDDLEILGVTRFYGTVDGADADEKTEIASLEKFKAKEGLPYSFVVSQNNTNQIIYGAGGLPTAVVIDRKGVVRYIETGTNPTRNDEIEEVVEKLLAEK